MQYGELLNLYFNRANALFNHWTLYVVVIGGLLAFSTLRQKRDPFKTLLISVLYLCFAYKNCTAIGDVIGERDAILATIRQTSVAGFVGNNEPLLRQQLEPKLDPVSYPSAKRFHISCDLLTVLALWGMERRRRLDQQTHASV